LAPTLSRVYVTPAAQDAYGQLTNQLQQSIASLTAKPALTADERTTLDAHRAVLDEFIRYVQPLFSRGE
jgi:hypothetical protein